MVAHDVSEIKTPIAVFFYNRPDTLREVLNQVALVRSPRIYLISDGIDTNREHDEDLVLKCRAVAEHFHASGEVVRIYRERRIGLFENITSGIEEVFKTENRCIFLEDDTVPSLTFFNYCDELLDFYENSPNIISISGYKLISDWIHPNKENQSYFFSKYPQVWGWATWKSKWEQHYDKEIETWPEWRNTKSFTGLFSRKREAKYWERKLTGVYQHKHTWDFQLVFSTFRNTLLTVVPCVNLVSNIGFGRPDSTNTTSVSSMANRPRKEIALPLRHPSLIIGEQGYDDRVSRWYAPTIAARLRFKFIRIKRRFIKSKH